MRVLAAAVLASLLFILPVQANLLINGNFDSITNTIDDDWGGTGWVRPAGNNVGHTTWPAYNSTLGAYFPAWDTGNSPGQLYQDYVTGSGQYTFSVWVKREVNANPTSLVLRLQWMGATTNVLQTDTIDITSIGNDSIFHQHHLTASCVNPSVTFLRAAIVGSWTNSGASNASLQFDQANLVAGGYLPELINAGFETPLGANDWINTFWLCVPDFFAISRQPWASRHGTAGAVFEGYDTRSNTFSGTLSQPFYPSPGSNYQFGISLKRESTNMLQTNMELRIEWYDSTYTNQVQTASIHNLGALPGDNNFRDFYVNGACTSPAVAEARVVLFGQWDENLLPAGGKAFMIDDARLVEGGPYVTYFNNDAGGYKSSVELVPGTNAAFFRADYATMTNTTYVLVRQGTLNQSTGEVGTVGLRYAWDAGFTNGGNDVAMLQVGSVTITNTAQFHGVPTNGAMVFDVYKAMWPMPQTNGTLLTNGFSVYYSPFLVFTNIAATQEVEKIYLVKTGGSITNSLGQQLSSQYVFNDYSYFNLIPNQPASLQNGDFETGVANSWTNASWIGFEGTERADWGFYTGLRGGVFYTWADYFGGIYQDVASTGGVYTFTIMFEKEPPVSMATCEMKLEWYSSLGEQITAQTNAITSPNDGRWHRLYFTVTNLHPNVSYVRPVLFADWNNATSSYANNDATRYDDASLYVGQFTNTTPGPFTNSDFNMAPGTFNLSKWDGVMNDAPYDYVGIDNWADRLAPGGTNWGADFRGFKTDETTMGGSISQGVIGQAPGTYVFGCYLKEESAMLLSNCALNITWYDRNFNIVGVSSNNVTAAIPADNNWHYYAVTGTCNSASLYEMRVGVSAVWGANLGVGSKALMMDDATLGSGILPDSDGDGMLDEWEMLYFGTLTNSASGDNDGDGSANSDEYLADTDPTVSGSYFVKQTNAVEAAETVQFRFNPSSTGRIYDVYWKTNLLNSEAWQAVGLSRQGSGGILILTVTNTPAVYKNYRTGIHLPP